MEMYWNIPNSASVFINVLIVFVRRNEMGLLIPTLIQLICTGVMVTCLFTFCNSVHAVFLPEQKTVRNVNKADRRHTPLIKMYVAEMIKLIYKDSKCFSRVRTKNYILFRIYFQSTKDLPKLAPVSRRCLNLWHENQKQSSTCLTQRASMPWATHNPPPNLLLLWCPDQFIPSTKEVVFSPDLFVCLYGSYITQKVKKKNK